MPSDTSRLSRASASLLVVLGLAWAGFGCSAPAKDKAAKFVPDIRTYACKRVPKGRIQVDGRIGAAEWAGATRVGRFVELVRRGRGAPTLREPFDRIQAWIAYDETNLYVAARVRDIDVVADPKLRNQLATRSILRGDAFELFLQPDPSKPTYFEFHVTPVNTRRELRMVAQSYTVWGKAAEWSPGLTTAATVQGTLNRIDRDQGWTVEIAVPFQGLPDAFGRTPRPAPGAAWRFSICLYDYAYYFDNGADVNARKYVSSSKHEYLSFHRRQTYDLLRFE